MAIINPGRPSAREVVAQAQAKANAGILAPMPSASERIARGNSAGLLKFANSRVPVQVLQQVASPEPSQRPPEPEVGARWGRPANLAFSLPDSSLGPKQEPPPGVVVVDDNEDRAFDGIGVLQATDHFGNVVAESPPLDPDENPFGMYTVYFCGTFDEKSEERKTLPTGVEVITPILTHVRQYVQWDEVPKWIDLRHTYTLSHDEAPVPPGAVPEKCGPKFIGPA
jgi:hypothetical protein